MVPLRSVFRIRDILVRIRILGSVPLINGYGTRILHFSSMTFKMPTKNISISFYFLCLSFLKVPLHHSSKIKSHKDVTKQQKSRFFFIFLLVDERIRIRIRTNNLRIQEDQKDQKHTDPTDPNPEHWLRLFFWNRCKMLSGPPRVGTVTWGNWPDNGLTVWPLW